jgi:pyruvate ferredoxin oxidoreductase beta subunit
MSTIKEIAQRESCFQPGSTLCTGCMESVAFQTIGKVTDNGRKTIYTMGTFCGEVSTLLYPNVVAWGRGQKTSEEFSKSFGIIHNVFESAPTVAEGIRDVADILTTSGALENPIQVVSNSGDGGAVAIGLRSLLHTIYRRARITIIVLVNEYFANTGFQYSPASSFGADTSTTPVGADGTGNHEHPLNYLHLCVAAGAGFVAQVSPAFSKVFFGAMEKAMECKETAVIFVPAPCITGWKFEDGAMMKLARLGAETGFFPVFQKEKGKKGSVKFCSLDPKERPSILEFMGLQRRFQHLVVKDKQTNQFIVRPGAEDRFAKVQASVQMNVEHLHKIAELDI